MEEEVLKIWGGKRRCRLRRCDNLELPKLGFCSKWVHTIKWEKSEGDKGLYMGLFTMIDPDIYRLWGKKEYQKVEGESKLVGISEAEVISESGYYR